ncbi:TPR-like protein [Tothia fuscella]|uniref:Tetratricopeptide repeat and J domain-containing co-chaperone DNJ1 n=1 Tax=Tothia fuscella TaxID=1048955 RepID=A0A9P4NMG9_9PEZI|nr:TPR-like protein [Tothia fuscella]
MLLPLSTLACAALLTPLSYALSPSDIPLDTPVSQLVKTAHVQLAAGKAQDALTYFDVAISRDPQNYLTIFKRGAAYLSLGKSNQAQKDFDQVLALKPGFEGALVQRAKIKARNGEWSDAESDYLAAGKGESEELAELRAAQGASKFAEEAAKQENWEECVQQAGIAILTAGTLLELRRLRARCRFEQGQVAEGVSDLQHVLQISSGSTEPHLQISAMKFYALGETEGGLNQIRKCLQSDPDSKPCRALFRREKALDKTMKKVLAAFEKRQFATAARHILKNSDEPGLMAEVNEDFESYKKEGLIHAKSPNGLYARLVEMTCEAYIEMNNHKRAQSYCTEALTHNPQSLPGLLAKAQTQLNADDFEAAMSTLNDAKEAHGNTDRIQTLLNEAQTLLKRSKQKDYYKVLGLTRDASDREIKKSFRKMTLQFHPDKAAAQGIGQEEAQKKMASINEAYEVLSDPELKARFDRGDDPNDAQNQGSPFQQGGGQQYMFRQGGFPGGSFQFQGGGFQFPGGF